MDAARLALDLWDYRRRVAEMYAELRRAGPGEEPWAHWRAGRDALFRSHPQSALEADRRPTFGGLRYFPHDPAWRIQVEVEAIPDEPAVLGHSAEGSTPFRRFGVAHFAAAGTAVSLSLFWLESYGGGVFVPFRDATSGSETYGGGRYLLDTAKGADLGHRDGRVTFDFNYAYHPSCVYSPRWSCPLAPPENRLPIEVRAGERDPGST